MVVAVRVVQTVHLGYEFLPLFCDRLDPQSIFIQSWYDVLQGVS